ncbi:YhdP family protein [Methylophilus aquaticus]|uniref:YhdP family protein n=1 Tax=Methylophilus aquaticus TaxID=1971610 RepID=A0ABT9JRQ5_9PROT|nr:YhdP family protein [Methylophilus aquaticus]MDP8567253.1 YhdP family protein [Methylophilus aquaticus]
MPLQKIKRWLVMLLLVIVVAFTCVIGALQFYVFPHINDYKNRIAQALTQSLQQKVSIAHIAVRWRGITPQITLGDIVLYDQQLRPALKLAKVASRLSWSSVMLLSPTLVSLRIDGPKLVVRRTATGEIFLAGISMSGQGNPAFGNWLLAQRRIKISHATVTWVDELRQAPPLTLSDLNIEMLTPVWQRLLGRHQIHLDSLLSHGTRERIFLEATVVGHDVANLPSWHGETSVRIPETDLAVWQPWLDIPVNLHRGQGKLIATLAFEANHIKRVAAELDLKQLSLSPPQHKQTFQATSLRGEVRWQRTEQGSVVHLKHLSADLEPGLKLEDTTGELTLGKDSQQGTLAIKKLALQNSPALAEWLPADSPIKTHLQNIAPTGTANQIKLHWLRTKNTLQNYDLEASLSAISTEAYEQIPGLKNWSGELSAHPNQGSLHLDTRQASIDTAGLLRWPLPIDRLEGTIRWDNNGKKTLITTSDLKFDNAHLALRLNAEYQLGASGGDTIQLQSQIERGDAKFAQNYYPNILGESTLHWLDTSILSGQIKRGEVIIKGRVKDFPFVNAAHVADPGLGLFRVTAQVQQAKLEYGTGWPVVSDVEAFLKFEGQRMDIEVKNAMTVGQRITQAHVEIPRLDADWPMLNIKSVAHSNIDQGVKFVNNSPVKEVTMGFTDDLKATGEAELHLDLQIPLENVDAAQFQGDYAIKNGHLAANAEIGLPEMHQINGHLKFNEKGLQAQNVQLLLFDNPANLSLSTRSDKSVIIQGSGRITDAALRKIDNNLLTRALHGTTDWKANILVKKPSLRLDIQSQLIGMSTNLPAPLNKSADMPASLNIRLRQENSQQDKIDVHYDDWIHANLIRNHAGQETSIKAGEIAINTPPRLPTTDGINVRADFQKLNVDEWLAYFKQQPGGDNSNSAKIPVSNIEITAGVLHIFDRNLHQIKLGISPLEDRLRLSMQSQELAGDADWLQGKQNKLIAKLNYLRIPRNIDTDNAPLGEIRRLNTVYPELEMTAQEFQFGDKQLGNLELKAFNSGENWIIQKMALTNPDSQLNADGVWRNSTRGPQTQLKFNLSSSNLGKTLQRFQPGGEMIKGGSGNMAGQLNWPGSPHEFAVERLDGDFSLQLEKGQILKVQPGVGRLLGLLSLQSLPRRLTLDFRDLFSEGFAFDKIACSANIRDGILRSDDLFMTGPAAEAKIKGETNLKAETQRLRVKVVPHISDSFSLAALAGGPIVGVAAFVAQKLLKDPLNKISSSEYMITGTWDNPQEAEVDKATPSNQSPARSIR